MQRLPLQLSVSALLIVVAGVALNLWLFRFGMLAGLVGLSVTKHMVIAWLCQVLGIDRSKPAPRPRRRRTRFGAADPASVPATGPGALG